MNFGEKLSRLRGEKKYSQEELAEKINVSRQTIRRWEYEESLPDVYQLKILCALFEVPPEFFLNEEVSPPRQPETAARPHEPQERPQTEKRKTGAFLLLALWIAAAALNFMNIFLSLSRAHSFSADMAVSLICCILCFGGAVGAICLLRKNRK